MLIHRCPWCGERIARLKDTNCPSCKKPLTFYKTKIKRNGKTRISFSFVFLFVLMFLLIPFRPPFSIIEWYDIPWLTALIFAVVIYMCWGFWKTPYARDLSKAEKKAVPEKQQVYATVSWDKHKTGGLRFPRIQVPSGEILPATFLNVNGQPISTELCIVLEDIKWKDSHNCTCRIQLVLDNLPSQDLFSTAETFYLYHDYTKIAQGVLR